MKLPDKVQPEKACTKARDLRPALEHPHLRDGVLEATNAYIAVRIPVEVEDGEPDGYVPREAIMASKAGRLDRHVALNETEARVPHAGSMFLRPNGLTFPKLAELWPEDQAEFEIGVNAEQLHDLAKALGVKTVALRLSKSGGELALKRPIEVRPLSVGEVAPEPDARGLLMPVEVKT